MRAYAVTMFVHVLGIIALFGAFVLHHRAIGRLRRAARREEARPWAELLVEIRAMLPAGAAMLLASGGYLAARLTAPTEAWIMVAATTVLLIGAVSLAVVNPYIGAVRDALRDGDGPMGAAADAIARPLPPTLLAAANGAALGATWLMTARPGMLEAVLAVAIPAVAGALIGARAARRTPRRAA
jgi:hypothetical protein